VKHVLLLVFSLAFGVLGAFILVEDIRHGGQLHVVSGSIGTGLLATSVALAIPMELKTALESLAPLLPFVGKRDV
jgi:hypothetical protein